MEQLFRELGKHRPRAVVILPVCNEEERLSACLFALLRQSVPHHFYEVDLLLNNCTDQSAAIVRGFQKAHPHFQLHIAEKVLPRHLANVGSARKMLMDEAYFRAGEGGAILSTDGDTVVAPDWVEMNLAHLHAGSELVGGDIALDGPDWERLPAQTRAQHKADEEYQRASTYLESLIDPDPHDPWPRHHHHFGASLSCTTAFYRRVGGLPPVDCLEDLALVAAARQADACLRHSTAVKVVTAARVAGRARVGLASQLRDWQGAADEPLVDSAAFLKTYFTFRRQIRRLWHRQDGSAAPAAAAMAAYLRIPLRVLEQILEGSSTFGAVHDALNLHSSLGKAMGPEHRGPRGRATKEITAMNARLCAAERSTCIAFDGILRASATAGGLKNSYAPDLR